MAVYMTAEQVQHFQAQAGKILPLPGRGRLTTGQYASQLEARYAGYLQTRVYAGEVHQVWYEPMGLRLAAKTFYHPDFMVQLASGELEIHETKGFMRDDAAAKLKVAARMYPCFRFVLVRWARKQWTWTEIPG